MKYAFTLESLESRTLLAGLEDDGCPFDGPGFAGTGEGINDVDEVDCSLGETNNNEASSTSEFSLPDSALYALKRTAVTLASAGMGAVEGGIVSIPSAVLILGGGYILKKVSQHLPESFSMAESLALPAAIFVGLATYPLSLEVMDELLTQDEPTDPVMKGLYPVKALVKASDAAIEYFEGIESLEVSAWAHALQPRSIKNFYWSAAATVFSGASGGFDYPHLELPERGHHAGEGVPLCVCEC